VKLSSDVALSATQSRLTCAATLVLLARYRPDSEDLVSQSEGHVEDVQAFNRYGEHRDRGDGASAAKSGIAGRVRSGC
jgi:hypothetical protein